MTELAVQQLLDAFRHLDAFGLRGPIDDRGLPDLPACADAALVDHLLRGLQLTKRIQDAGDGPVEDADLCAAAQELRAAAALLEEWR